MVPLLLIREGSLAGEEIDVRAEIVLGHEVDLVIEDAELSRRHARLRAVDGGIEVEDLGSLNGTWVNGARITEPARLNPGDILRLGVNVIEVPPQPRPAETVLSPSATITSPAATVASPVSTALAPVLVVTGGAHAGQRIALTAEVTLGREDDIDVELDDPELSRRHLFVRPIGEQVALEDLGSRNGTWLNGARLSEPATASPGDVIRLGTTTMTLELQPALAPAGVPGDGVRREAAPTMGFTERLARAAARRPGLTLAAWGGVLVLAVATIVIFLGSAVTTEIKLTNDPESLRSDTLLEERLPDPDAVDEIVVVRSETLTVDDAAFRSAVEGLAEEIEGSEGVERVTSFYSTGAATLVSQDRGATLVTVAMRGDEEEAEGFVASIVDAVQAAATPEVETFITGTASASLDQQELSQSDLKKRRARHRRPGRADHPVAGVRRGRGRRDPAGDGDRLDRRRVRHRRPSSASVYELSFLVTNIVPMIGLAVGIDYTLSIVQRFREERAHGWRSSTRSRRRRDREPARCSSPAARVIVGLLGMTDRAEQRVPEHRHRDAHPSSAVAVSLRADAAARRCSPARRQGERAAHPLHRRPSPPRGRRGRLLGPRLAR